MNIATLKKVWSKLALRQKFFTVIIALMHICFVIELCAEGLTFSTIFSYLFWTWFVMPLIYSDLTEDALKQPFLSIKAVYDAEKDK